MSPFFSHQYQMTYSLYIAAFAGAGITVLALVSGPTFGLLFRGCGAHVTAVPLLSGGVEASQASTADWQTVCPLFRRLTTPLPQNQYNAAAMCRRGLGGRSPLPQHRFRLCSIASAHISLLSCNGLSPFCILSTPVFLHFLSLLVPP